jgi:hypothetical protein
MNRRHHRSQKKKKARHPTATVPVQHEVLCQEHLDRRKEDDMKDTMSNPVPPSDNWIGWLGVSIAALALVTSFTQACYTRKAMRVDQRAWVSVPFPNTFPSNGTELHAITQIIDSGKTPAKAVQGDVIATVFSKDDNLTIGDFSIGHPHERFRAPGVIFPNIPMPITIAVGTYEAFGKKIVPADESLRKDIAEGRRFILFFGRLTYSDVFGVEHFTQFCTGSGMGISSDVLRDCLKYNDVDSNEE